jgi:hypothetical protein
MHKSDNDIAILTSTSVKQPVSNSEHNKNEISGYMFMSKYVIEKLIATDTTTTFKITHYIKLDYK